MAIYKKHLFVCQNQRETNNPLGCCHSKGAESVLNKLKALVKEQGLASQVRVNKAGCLGQCEFGVAAVVYPEGVWYENLDPEKAALIFKEHILDQVPVARFEILKSKES